MPSICLDMSFFHVQHVQSKLFTDYFICRFVVRLLPQPQLRIKRDPDISEGSVTRSGQANLMSNKVKYYIKFLSMQSWIYVYYLLFTY